MNEILDDAGNNPLLEFSVKLCAAVKKEKCLYDRTAMHKNTSPDIETAWVKVAKECNETSKWSFCCYFVGSISSYCVVLLEVFWSFIFNAFCFCFHFNKANKPYTYARIHSYIHSKYIYCGEVLCICVCIFV